MSPASCLTATNLVAGEAKTYEVRVPSLTRRLRRVLRVTEGPRRITDDEWRRGVESMLPLGTPELKRALLVARIMARQRPADASGISTHARRPRAAHVDWGLRESATIGVL